MDTGTDAARETWRVLGLELAVGEPDALLRARAAAELGLEPDELAGFRLARKALDARARGGERRLRFVCHADVVLPAGRRTARIARLERSGRLVRAPEIGRLETDDVHPHWRAGGRRVAVVGAGPAGVFCALVLARNGVPVTVLERGRAIERRGSDVVRFHRSRVPSPESNLLFGEGGAGTYSDGKLYTRVDDPLEVPLLEELVTCGAPREIVWDARAHIGTDRLHRVIPALRARLAALGVEFRFDTRVEGLVLAPGATAAAPRRVHALATSAGELGCDACVFAVGHSARDTWAALAAQGVAFEAKPFQLGVRVEHPQALVDRGRFGAGPEAAALGAASYNLVCKAEGGLPAVHSFCMCPGGRIVASVNSAAELCTNGMSNSTHSSRWANAAVVTTFGPREYGSGAFAGVAFQRALERAAFEAGGGDYTAPAQRVPDFLAGRESSGELATSFRFGARAARLDALLPPAARDALRRALERFDRGIPGFAGPEGLLVGVETRSSGPVRMPRDPDTFRARGFANLLPVGEGAGWAGGIMSAALDGARAARRLLAVGVD